MGKHRERNRNNRYDPLGKRFTKGTIQKDGKTVSTKGLDTIYEKLCSNDEGEFLPSLHSLAGLAGDGLESVMAIIKYSDASGPGIFIRKLVDFVENKNQSVILAATGIMRNLTACGKDEFLSQLMSLNIMRPLCDVIGYFRVPPVLIERENVQWQEKYKILEQASYTLYNLCEVSEDAVAACSELTAVLAQYCCAAPATLPPATLLAVNTALLCLTEDNPKACVALEGQLQQLQDCIRTVAEASCPDSLHLLNALSVAGILSNMDQCDIGGKNFNACMKLISASLSTPPSELLKSLVHEPSGVAATNGTKQSSNGSEAAPAVTDLPLDDISLNNENSAAAPRPTQDEGIEELVFNMESQNGGETDNGSVTRRNLTELQHMLGAQQLALELLNNICTEDDEDSEDASQCAEKPRPGVVQWVEGEAIKGEGEADKGNREDEESMQQDDDMNWEEMAVCDPSHQLAVLEPVLVKSGMFKKILRILEQPEQQLLQWVTGSKFGTQLHPLLMGVRVRCLGACQAMLELLDVRQVGAGLLLHCWTNLMHLAATLRDAEVTECGGVELEGITGALRALVGKLTPQEAAQLITSSHRQKLTDLNSICQLYCVAGARSNLCRVLGVLALLLLKGATVQTLSRDPLNTFFKEATEMLLCLAGNDRLLHVSAEALDVLIDVYSDDLTDRLAHECDLVRRLTRIKNYFNDRFQKEKKSLREHRVLIITVRDNLPAFIKYKEPRELNADPQKKHAMKEGGGKTKASDADAAKSKGKKGRRK